MNIDKWFQLIYLIIAIYFAFVGDVGFVVVFTGLMIIKKMDADKC